MNCPAGGADLNSALEIEAVVDRVSRLLHQHIGLRPEPGLRGRLRGCIRDDALRLGEGFERYLESLEVGSEALQGLLNKVTVQESAFFRHPEHFELLAREILPTLRAPIVLWSAACANGQEAFSLAMLLDELGVDGRVIATDLSTDALQRTRDARYTTRELGGLPLDRIARHLTREGDSWLVNSTIRNRVSTFHHNLLDPIPGQVRGCQVIFCRNVLIYFSPDHASTFLDRVADALPGTRLFLGSAETIWQLSSRFETLRSGDTFSYRRRADTAKANNPGPRPADGSRNQSGRPDEDRPGRVSVPAHGRTANPAPAPASVKRKADASGRPTRPAAVPSPTSPSRENDRREHDRRENDRRENDRREHDSGPAEVLRKAGELASASGDVLAAVIAFRKYAYLAPHDPMAHLHLGLALDSAGDLRSAQRAYAAARHALTLTDPARPDQTIEGYTPADLIRLLDSKQEVATP
jgi:chemotaxis methyl-accepting protein methylase